MKTKEIIGTGIITISGTLLGIALTFLFTIHKDNSEKEKDYLNLLKIAKTEIEFYLPMYKTSLSSTNDLLNKKTTSTTSTFGYYVSSSLLKQCKVELLKHTTSNTIVKHISGCHFDMGMFYENCQLNWTNFKKNDENLSYDLMKPKLEDHKKMVTAIISNANNTLILIQDEIDKVLK